MKTPPDTQIRADRMMMLWVGLCLACVMSSCGISNQPKPAPTDRPPTATELVEWRVKNGFTMASAADIAESKRHEASFVGGRAVAPDGGLKVAFRCGARVGSGYSNLSTTSKYVLQDAKGRELASGPSCLTKGESAAQRSWFSPDGKQAVVFEYVHECNGPPPFAILFYEDSDTPGLWRTKFLAMPEFLNAPYDEGANSECVGLKGDELLIKATTDGTISKKKISKLKERYPFPFTVG